MRELHRSYHKDVALDEWNEARESMNLPMHLYLPTGLSEQDKELILLRIDKKLSFDEIAEYYGITNDACRQRLSRAIRKCRSLLDAHLESSSKEITGNAMQDNFTISANLAAREAVQA